MLNQYFKIFRLLYVENSRKIKSKIISYPLLSIGIGVLFLIFSYALYIFIEQMVTPLIIILINSDQSIYFYKSLFFSAFILPGVIITMIFILSSEGENEFNIMLKNIRIPTKVINLVNFSLTSIISTLISFILLIIFILQGMILSTLSTSIVIVILCFIFFQSLIFSIFFSSLINYLKYISFRCGNPYYKFFINIFLMIVLSLSTYQYFSFNIYNLHDYSLLSLLFNPLIYFKIFKQDNVTIIPTIIYLSLIFLIFKVSIAKDGSSSLNKKEIILFKNKFRLLNPIFSTTLKETLRDKSVISNYLTILGIFIVIYLFFNSNLENDVVLQLIITSTLIVAFNGFAYYYAYKRYYIDTSHSLSIVINRLLPAIVIIIIFNLFLSLFVNRLISVFFQMLVLDVIMILFFYTLGFLIPFNQKNSTSSLIVVIILSIVLIPLSFLIQNIIIQYQISSNAIIIVGILITILLFFIVYTLVKFSMKNRKYNIGETVL